MRIDIMCSNENNVHLGEVAHVTAQRAKGGKGKKDNNAHLGEVAHVTAQGGKEHSIDGKAASEVDAR
jgi:hypothetical protein